MLRRPRGLSAFRHRNYRLFWTGQLISLIGTWMQSVAQAWLVLQLTNDPFALGLLSVAQFGPVMVLGLFGGVIADSLPKRQTLIATQAVQMVLAFVLSALVASGGVQVWHILVLAFLLGCANATCVRCGELSAAQAGGDSGMRPTVEFGPARVRTHARTVDAGDRRSARAPATRHAAMA